MAIPGAPREKVIEALKRFDAEIRDTDSSAKEMILGELAPPFSRIFANKEDALWAFEFIRLIAKKLGVNKPDDDRLVVNVVRHGAELHVTYARWMVAAFKRANSGEGRILLSLLKDLAVALENATPAFAFSQDESEPKVEAYWLRLDYVKPFPGEIKKAIDQSLDFIREKFVGYEASQYRRWKSTRVTNAVFDDRKLIEILQLGLSEDELGEDNGPASDQQGLTGELPAGRRGLSLAEIAAKSGVDEKELQRWVRAIRKKGQAILYGPPGTGKTFLAKMLAEYLAWGEGGMDGTVDLVQFHPAYEYEDFIQGIRPGIDDQGRLVYKLERGRFLKFCGDARQRQGLAVLIIDEINRANLSRVFGELMYLLEYRDSEVKLASGEELVTSDMMV